MTMLHRCLSHPLNLRSKLEYINVDGEEPVYLVIEAVDDNNNERGSSQWATAATSPALSVSSSDVNTPFEHLKNAASCQTSPFGLPAIQLHVMCDVDAEPQPTASDAGTLAEALLAQPSCGPGASPPRRELPATPAEPAAQPAEPTALPERTRTTSLALLDVDIAPAPAVPAAGHLGQQFSSGRATPAASSVCRRGASAGEEDTEDGDEATQEVATSTAAAAAGSLKVESVGCLPATSERGTAATSTADEEMSEAYDPAEEEEQHEEPEPSVQEAPGGNRLSAAAHQEPRRAAAAAAAAAVAAAAAASDVIGDADEDDGDEEYTERGRAGGAGARRGRRGGAPARRTAGGGVSKRTAGRVVSGNRCLDCGATETPQWRKGPRGPRTLCNACGTRHMKAMKARAAR